MSYLKAPDVLDVCQRIDHSRLALFILMQMQDVKIIGLSECGRDLALSFQEIAYKKP
jgi:hypothetical protein